MRLYGLIAHGSLARLEGPGQILCKYLFESYQEAEDYIPEFIPKCTTPIDDRDLKVLSKDEIRCQIIQFELKTILKSEL